MHLQIHVRPPAPITTEMLHRVLALLILALFYSQPLYAVAGGLPTVGILTTLWLLIRVWRFSLGDNTLLQGLRDYVGELAAYGVFVLVTIGSFLAQHGVSGYDHFIIVSRVWLAMFIAASYSRTSLLTMRNFCTSAIVVLGLIAWRSVPELWNTPYLVREGTWEPETWSSLLRKGIGGYGTYTSAAIVFPCLIAVVIGSKGAHRLLLAVLSIGIGASIALSSLMAALLTWVASSLLLAAASIWEKKFNLVTYLKAVALIMAISGLIWAYGGFAPQESLQFAIEKAERLSSESLVGGLSEGDETGRFDYLRASEESFLRHPWLGVGPFTHGENFQAGLIIGGHSSFMDQLAEYGIFGFGSYLVFVALLTRRVWLLFKFGSNRLIARSVAITWTAFLVTGVYNMVVLILEVSVMVFVVVIISSFRQCMGSALFKRLDRKRSNMAFSVQTVANSSSGMAEAIGK